MWLWIGIGLGAFFALSALISLAFAAMLGAISQGVTELQEGLFEATAWAGEPPPRRRRSRRRRRRLDEVTARALEPNP
jgi:hypothetical protein